MWDTLIPDIGHALAEDKNVTSWITALRRDPFVKIGTFAINELNFHTSTIIKAGSSVISTALTPFTYPLSKFVQTSKPKLIPLPFKVASKIRDNSRGELIAYKGNLFDKAQNALSDISSSLVSSKIPGVSKIYRAAASLISYPIHKLSEPSQEELVLMAIRMSFPDFQIGPFSNWLEKSFLPTLLSRYIRANAMLLSELCETQVITERSMTIMDYTSAGLLIMSRFLSLHDTEIIEYGFAGRSPSLTLRCSCDHTHDIRTSQNHIIVIGGPSEIVKTEYIIVIKLTKDRKDQPCWKVSEFHEGKTTPRI